MSRQLLLPFETIEPAPPSRPQPVTASSVPAPSDLQTSPPAGLAAASLGALLQRVYGRLRIRRPVVEFRAAFRPFAGLRSTISLRDGTLDAQFSDLLADAPPLVLEALAEILLCRLFRRRPSREARECYAAYSMRPRFRERVDEARRQRGSKRLRPAQGCFYDLESIFARLNQTYFNGEISIARIGWSPLRSKTVLGHYDAAHRTITISRWLDRPSVPAYLLDYVVYHEMLHVRYPVGRNGHRRIVHSPAFRAAERQFPYYERAEQRLKQLSGHVLD
jgi:hypothetical protein